eukprot:TRINITY_DN14528_c0_g1_i1.p1 TRINITY_DN14528_c0_g1~~TRINITY_DN14528_c0_g1_i1.p1  ORF type:complete len:194 (+),score=36.31 TRINITY_DN14528_c0_g1_i1:529-1110(+)
MGQSDEVFDTISLGWCEIPLISDKQDIVQTVFLKKGSPRELQSQASVNSQQTTVSATYKQTFSPSFNKVKYLVPENWLAGSNEFIPGILFQNLNQQKQNQVSFIEQLPCAEQEIDIPIRQYGKLYLTWAQLQFNARLENDFLRIITEQMKIAKKDNDCLLYTSDAADDMQCVDLGGRRIIKKKKQNETAHHSN